MKGTIVKCLEELVKQKAGPEVWKGILAKAGLPTSSMFTTTGVVPDADVLKLVGASAEALHVPVQGAMDAFGDHWSTTYAPKLYGVYFEKARSAKEFLLNLDNVHVLMTRTAGASPPRFTYEDKGPKDLVMHYSSSRHLEQMMPGLIQGVAKYYHEKVSVRREGSSLHIHFA